MCIDTNILKRNIIIIFLLMNLKFYLQFASQLTSPHCQAVLGARYMGVLYYMIHNLLLQLYYFS